MTFLNKRRRPAFRLPHPQTTVRWRLALLYGGLFLASGVALLAITYTLVEHDPLTNSAPSFIRAAVNAQGVHNATSTPRTVKRPPNAHFKQHAGGQAGQPGRSMRHHPPSNGIGPTWPPKLTQRANKRSRRNRAIA